MNAPPPYQPPPQQPPPGYGPPPQGYGAPPPGYGQPPHPPGPPQKKGMSGCLIAVLVVGGFLLLSGLIAAFAAYRFATSPDGQKIVSAVSSGAALAAAATNAPGAAELRAIGCSTALVIDASKIEQIAATLGDGGNVEVSGETLAIICSVNGSKNPSCDEVATTYVAAVGGAASGVFAVSVARGSGKSECEGEYEADGKRAPPPPQGTPAHGGTHGGHAPGHR